MALRSNPQTAPATTTFEEMDDMNTTTATPTAPATSANIAAPVVAAPAAMPVPHVAATKFRMAFKDMEGVLDTATVEALSLGSPRIKAEQGSAFMGDAELGSKFRLALVSYNPRWAVGSGTDDAESKDYFRVSYDNETLTTGEDMKDYIAALKAQGFNKASKTQYLDLWGFVTWTEKGGEVPVESRALTLVQCAPVSLGNFTSFATSRGLLESKGLVQPSEEIEVTCEKRVKGTNKYTCFTFAAPKA